MMFFGCASKSVGTAEIKYKSNAKVTSAPVPVDRNCWATIYSGENFTGKSATFTGDTHMQNLRFQRGIDFEGSVKSVKTGPIGKLYLYGNENFKDRDHSIPANTRVAKLTHIPSNDDIESLSLNCINQMSSDSVQRADIVRR